MAALYDIADYWPRPPRGAAYNKSWFYKDGVAKHTFQQYRNALDTEGVIGTRLDDYLIDAVTGALRHYDAWWFKPSPAGFIEFQDYVNGAIYKYLTGYEIFWGAPTALSPNNPTSGKPWGLTTDTMNFHIVQLAEVLPTMDTPFGQKTDVLVVPWVQTYRDSTVSKMQTCTYYMTKGHGPIRMDYPGIDPLYAKDDW
jgi:hypothetical protein